MQYIKTTKVQKLFCHLTIIGFNRTRKHSQYCRLICFYHKKHLNVDLLQWIPFVDNRRPPIIISTQTIYLLRGVRYRLFEATKTRSHCLVVPFWQCTLETVFSNGQALFHDYPHGILCLTVLDLSVWSQCTESEWWNFSKWFTKSLCKIDLI